VLDIVPFLSSSSSSLCTCTFCHGKIVVNTCCACPVNRPLLFDVRLSEIWLFLLFWSVAFSLFVSCYLMILIYWSDILAYLVYLLDLVVSI